MNTDIMNVLRRASHCNQPHFMCLTVESVDMSINIGSFFLFIMTFSSHFIKI